jgi:hypothetical protein
MKKLAFILLLLAGCASPLQRDLEQAVLEAKIATAEAGEQAVALEACEKRRRHARQCENHCQYGIEWHQVTNESKLD